MQYDSQGQPVREINILIIIITVYHTLAILPIQNTLSY
jgi:hypothetical protein